MFKFTIIVRLNLIIFNLLESIVVIKLQKQRSFVKVTPKKLKLTVYI